MGLPVAGHLDAGEVDETSAGRSGASSAPQPSSASNHLATPATAPARLGGFRAMGWWMHWDGTSG
jgi:hypothetical protein